MKKLIIFYFLLALLSVNAQEYKTFTVNKQIKDFTRNCEMKTPLDSYVLFTYMISEGEQGNLRKIFSETSAHKLPQSSTPKKVPDEKYVVNLLNSHIKEIVTYKDSIGYVIRDYSQNNMQIIGILFFENGQWRMVGEDICFSDSLTDAHNLIEEKNGLLIKKLRKFYSQSEVLSDTLDFVNHLKNNGLPPKDYLISKLSNHKLVIYGEQHRLKSSWDLMRALINNKNFAKVCGTVFMELPSNAQQKIDAFFARQTIDTNIILDILRDEQIYGWQDRGMYEFIENLWYINSSLDNKIRVILTDYQIPWHFINNKSEYDNYPRVNRDDNMADIIEQTLKSNTDERNSLFIVGLNHARKSSPERLHMWCKAGTQLTERLTENDIFAITIHTRSSDNFGNDYEQTRGGLVDYAFQSTGNIPVAFDLKDSPLGAEPFDAIAEVRFEADCGSYNDFYDGYIILNSVVREPEYILFDIFTDEFVVELKRRALITNSKYGWYGIDAENLTRAAIIERLNNN